MALYQEAASILEAHGSKAGSLKSNIYDSRKSYRSKPAMIYALISEVSKWDTLLKEVIDNATILLQEPKVCLDCHYHLFLTMLTNSGDVE